MITFDFFELFQLKGQVLKNKCILSMKGNLGPYHK